jgi:hypothetical protein
MLSASGNTPHGVLAVLRAYAARAARAAGEDQLLAAGAQPLAGGRNNAAYQWESPGGSVCVKIYRVDGRAGPSGNGCPSPSCPGTSSAALRSPYGPTRTPCSRLSA